MGNNVAAGHVLAATGVTQAVGFHKTLGQMMYQYSIQPWDPKVLLQASLERQQELQRTSPFRFIPVDEGLRFYGAQLGGIIHVLSRERFVEMSLNLFKTKGLHLPVEEARLFYDIFDSIDLYMNAQLSIGELAGGLSSFFSGTNEAKADAVFDLLAGGKDQIGMASLEQFLKPYVWCMVPQSAEVLRPLLLPHVVQEIYSDMSVSATGYLTRPELQRWTQKGCLSQGQVAPNHTSMSFTIVDRAAMSISLALRVAWHEYEQKYQLREYGQQTWQQNHGKRPQYLQDVGVTRYVAQATPTVTTSTTSVFQSVGQVGNQVFQSASQGVAHMTTWLADAERRGSEDYSYAGTSTRRLSADSITSTTTLEQSLPSLPTSSPGVSAPLPTNEFGPVRAAPQQSTAVAQLAAPQQAMTSAPSLFASIGTLPSVAELPSTPFPLHSLKHQAPQSVRTFGAGQEVVQGLPAARPIYAVR